MTKYRKPLVTIYQYLSSIYPVFISDNETPKVAPRRGTLQGGALPEGKYPNEKGGEKYGIFRTQDIDKGP